MGEARKEGVAVVLVRSDKAVNQDGSGMGVREGWKQFVTQVKVSRPSNVNNVGLKGRCAIEDDAKTLDLRGGANSTVVNG